jgi:hypothetical protein
MGAAASTPSARPKVAEGMTRICVSGFGLSHNSGSARKVADSIAKMYPDKYETWYHFDTSTFQGIFLPSIKTELSQEDQTKFAAHKSSPFCWTETADEKKAIGGRDDLCEWALANFKNEQDEVFLKRCRTGPSLFSDLIFDNKSPGTAKTE